jgi:hypothetical protein
MKKIRLKIIFCLLSGLFCLYGLSAEHHSEYFFTTNTTPLNQLLIKPEAMNLWNLSRNMETQLLPYTMMLSQFEKNLNQPMDMSQNSNSESSELMTLLNSQMMNLLNLETQWQAMELHYKTVSSYNAELLSLLEESKQTIAQLRLNLEIAFERVQDAEEGAITLLNENTEIYQRAKNAVAKISTLQSQLAKSKRSVIIGYAVGGVSFGVGTPLFINGIRTKNSTMAWAGAGTIAGTGAIWAVGHFIFQWW